MDSALHITNGDSAAGLIRESGIPGDVIAWRDVLHDGPVPAGLTLDELRDVRAEFLSGVGAGEFDEIRRDFADRDDALRRFTDHDEVVLWFEWDLYDQLQLIQILDFFSGYSLEDLAETNTTLSLVSYAGYLGTLGADEFPALLATRKPVDEQTLADARAAWAAFRNDDPRSMQTVRHLKNPTGLPFLPDAFLRHLEEFPSVHNGLSRSESQILEAVAHGSESFSSIFRSVSNREDRVFCGDLTLAAYIERMSECSTPLIVYPSDERIDAPRTEEDSRAFRNAQMVLTEAGRKVLSHESDWIALGGSDRWLGGVHLAGRSARWRWDSGTQTLQDVRTETLQ